LSPSTYPLFEQKDEHRKEKERELFSIFILIIQRKETSRVGRVSPHLSEERKTGTKKEEVARSLLRPEKATQSRCSRREGRKKVKKAFVFPPSR